MNSHTTNIPSFLLNATCQSRAQYQVPKFKLSTSKMNWNAFKWPTSSKQTSQRTLNGAPPNSGPTHSWISVSNESEIANPTSRR